MNAIQEQSEKFLHSSFNIIPNFNYVQLCEKINQHSPGQFEKKSILKKKKKKKKIFKKKKKKKKKFFNKKKEQKVLKIKLKLKIQINK